MTKAAADRQREGYQHWDMTELGWKYNMDNLQAAILLPQLERLDANWSKRTAIAADYQRRLANVPGLSLPRVVTGVRHARHLFPVWIANGRRDEVIATLRSRGISVMVNYRAIHLLSYFRDRLGHAAGAFPNAERIGDATLSLPLYAALAPEQVARVADELIDAVAPFIDARSVAAAASAL
jgi:UDP-4-amino-4-deoxy-L-arabinose-oxoglutarate aminotransferase